jgi:hypothetical protein
MNELLKEMCYCSRSEFKPRKLSARLKEEAYDKLLHEADLEDQLALAEKQLEYAKRRLTIDKERVETRSMSTLQYRSSELTVGDALTQVELLKADLLIAAIKRIVAQLE